MLCLLNVLRDTFRGFYVLALRRLAAAAKQYDNLTPLHGEVHPIARAVIDAEFRDAISYRFGIAEADNRYTAYTGGYDRLGYPIFHPADPFFEVFRFPNRYHT
jgi:hypothetical protein